MIYGEKDNQYIYLLKIQTIHVTNYASDKMSFSVTPEHTSPRRLSIIAWRHTLGYRECKIQTIAFSTEA